MLTSTGFNCTAIVMSAVQEPVSRIKIAIIGAGMTSLHLYYGLSRFRHISCSIYEASHSPRADGAAVGLGENAQAALKLLGDPAYQTLLDAGAVRMEPHVRFMIGTGPEAGKNVKDVECDVSQMVVGRARWLERVRGLLPEGAVRMGKRLVKIEPVCGNEQLTVRFDDGSEELVDAVIGCDGINSCVRRYVLEPKYPDLAAPFYTRGHNHRVTIPMEQAQEAFGEAYCAARTQHAWIGQRGFLLTDIIDNGRQMQVVAGFVGDVVWPHQSPVVPYEMAALANDLANWGEVGKGMIRIFSAQPRLFAAAGRLHSETPTFCKGRICIAGDAAQTFGPFQGAGVGQGLEDALILTTLLGACYDGKDLKHAFQAYDELRRPRRQDIARTSAQSAAMLTGMSDAEVNVDALQRKLQGWGHNIWDYDLEAAQSQAMGMLSERCKR